MNGTDPRFRGNDGAAVPGHTQANHMALIQFYHLESRPLEAVLPVLLDKTLERGWRAVVQTTSDEHIESLSRALWTWRDDAFLAHGEAKLGNADLQPIWLCTDDETPNAANLRFCVHGAEAADPGAFDRVIYMFDGNNEDAVLKAREQWKTLAKDGHDVTYWKQTPQGGWEQKA